MKKEAQKPVNRCFGDNCPQDPEKREQKIKEVLSVASQKKLARRALDALKEERRCGYAGLLKFTETWVATNRMSLYVFEELIRILEEQRSRNKLSWDEIKDLETAKASPVRQQK